MRLPRTIDEFNDVAFVVANAKRVERMLMIQEKIEKERRIRREWLDVVGIMDEHTKCAICGRSEDAVDFRPATLSNAELLEMEKLLEADVIGPRIPLCGECFKREVVPLVTRRAFLKLNCAR